MLVPTRELATQVHQVMERFGEAVGLKVAVLFGGVGLQAQADVLADGVDVVVATPGRLLHLHRLGHLQLEGIRHLVLDECDRMLDDSFVDELQAVVGLLPPARQTALFSATVPPAIERLSATLLRDPVRVDVTEDEASVDGVEQHVLFVAKERKRQLLVHVVQERSMERVLVFTRTKSGADGAATALVAAGLDAVSIHGDKTQAMRTQALQRFRDGDVGILVATDVASRGLDVDGVTHVVNVDLPSESETYVHRVGRTGRAGRGGVALSFCDATEGGYLRDLERLTGRNLAPIIDQPFHDWDLVPDLRAAGAGRRRGSRRGRRRSRR